ncbi:MAG TPA: FkbM family methyltransferase [Bryobacteraceae bacterium]|jgi:FkbM family methyltransferase|nr:FkbM family methyltransferase [Bryobacteraceae bacterium]
MPSNDDQPFHHYKLKHRLIAWVSTHLFDQMTYTVRHGLLTGMKRKGGLGWVPDSLSKQTETAERRFWKGLDLRGKVVYDVGAFQGLLTLFFARQARQVIAYEPNTNNHKRLLENLSLNRLSNVHVRKTGIGSSPQTMRMVVNPLMPGGASVEGKTTEQLLRSEAPVQTEEIPITTLDLELAAGMPAPEFIKIDIEGWEIEALKGARQILLTHKPALFLEMHGETVNEKRRKVAEIVDFLDGVGYRNIRHIESGTLITPQNSSAAMEGHLYCLPQA